jgi:hypothetical protein
MSKYIRHQAAINRTSDEHISEDHWLKQFEKTLQKGAVQPKSPQSIYDQISSIMNGNTPKYTSVQSAVDDMMQRSGVSNYLKTSKEQEISKTKTAADQNDAFQKQVPIEAKNNDTPDVIKEMPVIRTTLENYIKATRGNLPIPAIIDKIRSIHQSDISEDKMWDEDKLIRLVSRLNLEAKKNNPANYENYSNLASGDHDISESDIDPSNNDAFHGLQPTKL